MNGSPDAAGGGEPGEVPVLSTVSGTFAAATVAEPAEASGTAATEKAETSPPRQPVVRVRGSRRARLLAAPGTTAEPAPADDRERGRGSKPAASGPNDDRMLGDVPPHY